LWVPCLLSRGPVDRGRGQAQGLPLQIAVALSFSASLGKGRTPGSVKRMLPILHSPFSIPPGPAPIIRTSLVVPPPGVIAILSKGPFSICRGTPCGCPILAPARQGQAQGVPLQIAVALSFYASLGKGRTPASVKRRLPILHSPFSILHSQFLVGFITPFIVQSRPASFGKQPPHTV